MSVRLVTDEHIARKLLVGLRRIVDDVDVVHVQDVGLRTFDDPIILAWAADAGRVLVTQDIRTMPDFAHQRVAAGLPMPGIFVLPTMMPVADNSTSTEGAASASTTLSGASSMRLGCVTSKEPTWRTRQSSDGCAEVANHPNFSRWPGHSPAR